MNSNSRSLMRPPGAGVVRRSVIIAALWSMVAALVGATVVVLVGLIAAAVAGVAWLISSGDSSLATSEMVWQSVGVATWVVAGLVMAVSVWVAAYSSTEWGSRPRALLGIAGTAVATAAYFLLGSGGLVIAGLGMGWAIAIPAERVGRLAARAVVCLLVGLAMPAIDTLSVGLLAIVIVASPWGAALLCWAADALWALVMRQQTVPVDH